MVNNFTNNNKASNHLSPQINENKNKNKKETTTYDFGKPVPGLVYVQTCGGVKSVNGIPTLS